MMKRMSSTQLTHVHIRSLFYIWKRRCDSPQWDLPLSIYLSSLTVPFSSGGFRPGSVSLLSPTAALRLHIPLLLFFLPTPHTKAELSMLMLHPFLFHSSSKRICGRSEVSEWALVREVGCSPGRSKVEVYSSSGSSLGPSEEHRRRSMVHPTGAVFCASSGPRLQPVCYLQPHHHQCLLLFLLLQPSCSASAAPAAKAPAPTTTGTSLILLPLFSCCFCCCCNSCCLCFCCYEELLSGRTVFPSCQRAGLLKMRALSISCAREAVLCNPPSPRIASNPPCISLLCTPLPPNWLQLAAPDAAASHILLPNIGCW